MTAPVLIWFLLVFSFLLLMGYPSTPV